MSTTELRCLIRIIAFTLTCGLAMADFSVEDCKAFGFVKPVLLCSTCRQMENFNLNETMAECFNCCTKDDDNASYEKSSRAVLEFCTCKFLAYPQIRAFVESDRPKKYENLKIAYVQGAEPKIKLFDEDNKVKDILHINLWDTETVDEFLRTHLRGQN